MGHPGGVNIGAGATSYPYTHTTPCPCQPFPHLLPPTTPPTFGNILRESWASLVAQVVMNLPAMWEAWVRSLGWDDPLETIKATHSSILAWRIPWTL